jgi:hypothetical protein
MNIAQSTLATSKTQSSSSRAQFDAGDGAGRIHERFLWLHTTRSSGRTPILGTKPGVLPKRTAPSELDTMGPCRPSGCSISPQVHDSRLITLSMVSCAALARSVGSSASVAPAWQQQYRKAVHFAASKAVPVQRSSVNRQQRRMSVTAEATSNGASKRKPLCTCQQSQSSCSCICISRAWQAHAVASGRLVSISCRQRRLRCCLTRLVVFCCCSPAGHPGCKEGHP